MDLPIIPTVNMNEWMIFGLLIFSGYFYLFYLRNKYKIRDKNSIKFEVDVLFQSIFFGVLFFTATVGLFDVNTISKLFLWTDIISFNSIAIEFFIIFSFILIMDGFPRILNAPKFYMRNAIKINLIYFLSIGALVAIYFYLKNDIFAILSLDLLIFYILFFAPLLVVIKITDFAWEIKDKR